MGRTVIFYTTKDGKCPVIDFLDSLSDKAAQKITWVLSILEDYDFIPKTYLKKLLGTDDIWECRVKFGSNIYRIFCFFAGDSVVVLTHGYQKKSQKTSKTEIKKAEAYKKDYISRRAK